MQGLEVAAGVPLPPPPPPHPLTTKLPGHVADSLLSRAEEAPQPGCIGIGLVAPAEAAQLLGSNPGNKRISYREQAAKLVAEGGGAVLNACREGMPEAAPYAMPASLAQLKRTGYFGGNPSKDEEYGFVLNWTTFKFLDRETEAPQIEVGMLPLAWQSMGAWGSRSVADL